MDGARSAANRAIDDAGEAGPGGSRGAAPDPCGPVPASHADAEGRLLRREDAIRAFADDAAFAPFLRRAASEGPARPSVMTEVGGHELPIGFGRVALSRRNLTLSTGFEWEDPPCERDPVPSHPTLVDWTGWGRESVSGPFLPFHLFAYARRVRDGDRPPRDGRPDRTDAEQVRLGRAASAALMAFTLWKSADREDRRLAADLFSGAAAVKCALGLADHCVEEFVLVTEICLSNGDYERAMAAMRRALACAQLSYDALDRLRAGLNAVEVYARLGRWNRVAEVLETLSNSAGTLGPAAEHAVESTRARLGDRRRSRRGKRTRCENCSAGTYRDCCGRADHDPVELFAYRTVGAQRFPVTPFDAAPVPGNGPLLSRYMTLAASRERRSQFLLWTYRDGWWQMEAFPDLANRHLRLARMMRDLSLKEPDWADGPTGAVLHVVCALEAFLNATTHFVSLDGKEAWGGRGLPDWVFEKQQFRTRTDLYSKLEMINGLVGAERDLSEFLAAWWKLIDLRNRVVHFKSEEIHGLSVGERSSGEFLKGWPPDIRIRPGPAHWIDRLMTPELADWAVSHVERTIEMFGSAFRTAHGDRDADRCAGPDILGREP